MPGVSSKTPITYNFFKEKLYSIFLDVDGKGNVKGLIKTLEKRYGKQHSYELHTYPKTAAQVEIREWAGTRVYCVYKNGSDFNGGVLTFLDKPTWDALQVPKRGKSCIQSGRGRQEASKTLEERYAHMLKGIGTWDFAGGMLRFRRQGCVPEETSGLRRWNGDFGDPAGVHCV